MPSKTCPLPSTDVEVTNQEGPSSDVVLEPHLSPRFGLCLHHVGLVAVFALSFLAINLLPLHFSDIWGHVTYGEYILQNQQLPQEDPVVPLAHGVPLVATAWLSQIFFALVVRVAGPVGLTSLFALTLLASYQFIYGMSWIQTRRWDLALVGTALAILLGINRLLVIRPEIFGVLSLAVLMFLVALVDQAGERRRKGEAKAGHRLFWVLAFLLPLIFCFWANAHGSFPVGLLVLGCHFLGRVLDVACQERSFQAVFTDRWTWRWLALTELAFAGTLVNPQGMDLLLYVTTFGQNPNLEGILEWQPLQIGVLGWHQFLASWVLLIVVVRLSPRRFSLAQVLMLAVFTVLFIKTSRMLTWYAIIYTYCVLPHLQAVLARFASHFAQPTVHPGELRETLYGPTFKHTAVCLLVVWTAFAISPLSAPVLGGGPVAPERLYHERTPRGVTEHFRAFPPEGQLYNPQWWGDWLVWDGPKQLRPFITTNSIHLAPPQLWRDYETITEAAAGWATLLQKYNVRTVVLDRVEQQRLETYLRGHSQWTLSYEDDLAVVFNYTPRAPQTEAAELDTKAEPNSTGLLETAQTNH